MGRKMIWICLSVEWHISDDVFIRNLIFVVEKFIINIMYNLENI